MVLQVGVPVEVVLVLAVGLDLRRRGRLRRRHVRDLGRRDLALQLDPVLQLDRGDVLLVGRADLLALLEHRVFEQLVANEVLQLRAGQLQQFDGLLQLGCHHQLLAHPQF